MTRYSNECSNVWNDFLTLGLNVTENRWMQMLFPIHKHKQDNRRQQFSPLVRNSQSVGHTSGLYRWAKFGWNLACYACLFILLPLRQNLLLERERERERESRDQQMVHRRQPVNTCLRCIVSTDSDAANNRPHRLVQYCFYPRDAMLAWV